MFPRKRMPRWDTFKMPAVAADSSMGGFAPEETSGVPVTPSVTPSNTPTPSVTAQPTPTPSVSPTNTNTPTPSVTAQPTSTPTNTPTNSSTPIVSPSGTATPTPTPSNTQFCKRFTGLQTTIGNGSTYNYTACNNSGGSVRLPNSSFGSTVTIYSRSGAPTRTSGTGTMTWTDQGFSEPCGGSSFYSYVCNTNLGSSATVTDCGGATYNIFLAATGQSFAGCFTAIACNSNCSQVSITNLGSCTT